MIKKNILNRILFSFAVFIALACLWDNDTIEMETKQFPDTLDLMTGNFLRHSKEYYHWRILDRRDKLRQFPDSLDYYDDLAVSYSKLGQDSMAIQLMLKKDSIAPGEYRTMANLGTFYVHHGDSKTGKKYIETAIKINPDAHFGRERIQLELVKYALNKRDNGVIGLPLCEETPAWIYGRHRRNKPFNFYKHLIKAKISVEEGVKGVEGMLRFGNFDSPVLLEALGDVLLQDNGGRDMNPPRNLATMAYLKAGIEAPKYEKIYHEKAKVAFEAVGDSRKKYKEVSDRLTNGIKKGKENFARIRANEIFWILNGMDPEAEYKKHYYDNDAENRVNFEAEGSEAYHDLAPDSVSAALLQYLDQIKSPPKVDSAKIQNHLSAEKVADKDPEEIRSEPIVHFWLMIGIATVVGVLLVILAIIRRRR
jgi:hypothetical protein